MAFLILYTTCFDWITATSFDDNFHAFWWEKLKDNDEKTEAKVMQYHGYHFPLENGSAFLGTADQHGRSHYMLRLSGYEAEQNKLPILLQFRQGFVKITRVDFQVTIPKPADWSQWDLHVRLKERGRLTNWIESKIYGKGFQTVYVGSRSSNRFARIYLKESGEGDILLRFEMEYKGQRANAIVKRLAHDGELPDEYLRHELQTTFKDEPLSLLFEPCLSGIRPANVRLKVASSAEKREKWLLGQVLPAFTKHINSHEASGRVLEEFKKAIERTNGRYWQ